MDEVLNKDVFIGFVIVLLVIAILVNLALLTLLFCPLKNRHDVIWPFSKLCLVRHSRAVGSEASRSKRWVMAVCCLCHLLSACFHHALLLSLYRSRDGHLPPPAACSTLVLTELSAFLFPALSRLLLALLVVTEVFRMTSVAYLQPVTCVLMTAAGVYVCGVILPVFFFLYLESATQPCYEGRSILRYTSNSSEGRVLPVLSYVLPVLLIVVAVVIMIIAYNLRQSSPSSRTASTVSRNFPAHRNGPEDLGDSGLVNNCWCCNERKTSTRTRSGLDYCKSSISGRVYQSEPIIINSVTFPWNTLVVSALVIMSEFVFCVRQFAYWAQVDGGFVSASQWIQLWAADRILSLLSLILVPCCWLCDPSIRRGFHGHSSTVTSPAGSHKHTQDAWPEKRPNSTETARHLDTHPVGVYQNMFDRNGIHSYENTAAPFNIDRNADRKTFSTQFERTEDAKSMETHDEFYHGASPYHRDTVHHRVMHADGNDQESFYPKQTSGWQDSYHSDQWKAGDEDTMMTCGHHRTPQGSAEQRSRTTEDNSAPCKGRSFQGSSDHSHSWQSRHEPASSTDVYLSFSHEPNQTSWLKSDETLHDGKKSAATVQSQREKEFWRSNEHSNEQTAGLKSLQRSGASAPFVLHGDSTNYSDVFPRNRSYPDVSAARTAGPVLDRTDVRNGRNRVHQHRQPDWSSRSRRQAEEERTFAGNNHFKSAVENSREQDNQHPRPELGRRDDYRRKQENSYFLAPDDRRENSSRTRRGYTSHTDDYYSSAQPKGLSPHEEPTANERKHVTHNNIYQPAEETTPQNGNHQGDITSLNRDVPTGTRRAIISHPDRTLRKEQLTSPDRQNRFAGPPPRCGQFENRQKSPPEPVADRDGIYRKERLGFAQQHMTTEMEEDMQRDRRHYQVGGQSEHSMKTHRFRNSQDTTAKQTAPERAVRDMDRKSERQGMGKRPDITTIPDKSGIHPTVQEHRRLASQAALSHKQGQLRYTSYTRKWDQDRFQHQEFSGKEDEDNFRHKHPAGWFSEHLQGHKTSANDPSQGHSGYNRFADLHQQSGTTYNGLLSQQDQGHVVLTVQGHDQRDQNKSSREGGIDGGSLMFGGKRQRNHGYLYNPESTC